MFLRLSQGTYTNGYSIRVLLSVCSNILLVDVRIKHHPTKKGIVHLQEMFEGDVQNPQFMGHLPTPVLI